LGWRALATALLIALSCELPTALAQGRARPVRIGGLTVSWGWTPGFVGLREGLLELGYREGEDFVIGVRFTGGNVAGLEAAARDLVAQGADILVSGEGDSAVAALAATTQIPIVMVTGSDPVRRGLAQSYARPGGNLTGVTDLDLNLAAKRLEMFREIVPGLRRILFAYDSADRYSGAEVAAYRDGAHRLGLTLVERPIRGQAAAEALFSRLRRGEVDGMLGPISLTSNIPGLVLEAASRLTLPAMFMGSFYVEQGGLANYGANYHASGRQAARLVDKIIRGIKPATIPIEVSSKIEFVINLNAARALGLRIPREVLYQADRIIR
jgi:putative tryptophan/tyrosine transport system substrate-binding protein